MATPTPFQKLAVDHVSFHGGAPALDYPALKNGGFEAVYFRPEEGADTVAQRIDYATKQDTFRGTKFDGNVWAADPSSSDSVEAGIPRDATGWAYWLIGFVKDLRARGHGPKILKLNIEVSGKGFPPWRPGLTVQPWMKVRATGPDGLVRLYYTPNGGTTGQRAPAWLTSSTNGVNDNGVTWLLQEPGGAAYPYYGGWAFNQAAADVFAAELPDQLLMTQPLGGQSDFNRGAWSKKCNARESPQCYGDQPYNALRDPGDEISSSAGDPYAPAYYGVKIDRRLIHPTLGAGGSAFYAPRIAKARQSGPFGFSVYRADALTPADYTDYRQFAIV